MKNFILNRLREPSTIYASLLMASVFLGVDLSPEQKDVIVNLAVVVCGGAAILTPDGMRVGRKERDQ